MSKDTFIYNYSAKENAEVQAIRKKYMPADENSIEELRRLDALVQNAGVMEALIAGVGGMMIFGLGMCLAMQVIGEGVMLMILGIIVGIVGIIGILAAYPVYRKAYAKTKAQYSQRILELDSKLTGEKPAIF